MGILKRKEMKLKWTFLGFLFIVVLFAGTPASAWDDEWVRQLPKGMSPHMWWFLPELHAPYGRSRQRSTYKNSNL